MNILLDNHRLILKKLLQKGVDFILIGGYAVNYYGYNRSTGDMDIWVKPDNGNKLLLLEVLRELDFDEEGINIIRGWDFTQHHVFNIWEKPFRTDFITIISGVRYDEAKKSRIQADIEDMKVPIIHLNDLIIAKMSSDRPKDKVDVEYLQKIISLRKKK